MEVKSCMGAHTQSTVCRRDDRSTRHAFTLVELAITILIIGILTATAAPKFANAVRTMRVEAACRRIKADLALARQSAISASDDKLVQFTTDSGVYSIPGLSSLDRPSASYSVDLSQAPYRVTIISAMLGSDTNIQFDYFGQPDTGGVITVGSGSATGTVTVDAHTGRASIP